MADRIRAGKIIWLAFLLLVAMVVAGGVFFFLVRPQSPKPPAKQGRKNVLVISSFHPVSPWTCDFLTEMEKQIAGLPWEISYNVVDLDGMRIRDPVVWQRRLDREMPYLKAFRYDLILALDDEAMDLLMVNSDRIPASIPIVFAGYEKDPAPLRRARPNVTGVRQRYNLEGNIEVGHKLWPEAAEAVVLSDSTPAGSYCETQWRRAFSSEPALKVTFLHQDGQSDAELLAELERKGGVFFLIFNPWRDTSKEAYQTLQAFGVELARRLGRPYLVSINALVGYGALGGYATDAREHATETLAVMKDVLAAGSAEGVPIRDGTLRPIFDYRAMADHGLDFRMLPAAVVLLNVPPSIWDRYGNEILLASGLFVLVLLALILSWIYLWRYRQISRASLAVFDRLPIRVVVIDRSERVLFVHGEDGAPEAGTVIEKLSDFKGMDYPRMAAIFRQVFETQTPVSVEYEYYDAKRVMRIAPLPYEMYGRDTLIWISHDNSELQAARDALQDSFDRFELMFHNLPAYALFKDIDNDFRFVLCNRLCCEFLGRPESEIIGFRDSDLLKGIPEAEILLAMDREAAASETVHECTMTVTGCDGIVRLGRFSRKVLKQRNGRRLLFIMVMDITELEQSKSKLENANHLWNTVINALPVSFFAKDADDDFRYILLNNAFAELLRRPVAEIIGKTDRELLGDTAEVKISEQQDRTVMQSGKSVNSVDKLMVGEEMRVLRMNKLPFETVDRHRMLLGTAVDISHEVNLLESEQITNKALQLVLLEPDFRNNLDKMARNLQKQLRCDRIFIGICDENEGARIGRHYQWQRRGKNAAEKFSVADAERLFASALPEFRDDGIILLQSSLVDGDMLRELGIHSLMGAPVFLEGRLWGIVLVSFDRDKRIFSEVDEGIIRATANLIALTWIRAHQQEKLDENRKILEALLDNLPIAVVVKDAEQEFRYLMFNPAFCELTGLSREELIGKNDYESGIFPGFEEEVHALDVKAMAEGKILHSVETLNFRNRGCKFFERFKIPLHLANGRRLLLVSFMDISELNHFVESERITNEALAQVALETDFEKNVDQVLTTVAKQMDSDCLSLALYDPATDRYELIREKFSENQIRLEDVSLAEQRAFFAMFHAAFADNRLVMISDVATSPLASIQKNYHTVSLVAAPLFVDNCLAGGLYIGFSHGRRDFSELDERLMRSMTNIIALALIRKRQMEGLQRANREKQTILNNIRILIWLYDAQGRLLRVNTAVCELMHVSEEEILRNPAGCRFTAGDGAEPVEIVMKSGRAKQLEMSFGGRDYIVSAEPVYDDGGMLFSIVKSAFDVTELNALNENERILNVCLEKLLGTEELAATLAALTTDIGSHLHAQGAGVFAFRPNGVVEPFGTAGLPKLHIRWDSETDNWHSRLERQGRLTADSMADAETSPTLGDWVGYGMVAGVNSFAMEGIFLDGALWGAIVVAYSAASCPLDAQHAKLLKAIAHLLELAVGRENNRNRLVQALKQAQDASKAKSFFLASMSHEIRTPLNAVIGFAELLKDGNLSREAQLDYLTGISHSGNALLDLINDVLDLSKLEAEQMVFHPEKIDFEALCHEVGNIFRGRLTEKGVRLDYEIASMPRVFLDRLRMRQILFNLLGNAVKFTERGAIVLETAFTVSSPEQGALLVRVRDTGIGIPAEDQGRLFEPFVQSKSMRGTHAANQGTGLGLAIVTRMLTQMGGRITVMSREGEGSVFSVILPNIGYVWDRTIPEIPEEPRAALPRQYRVMLVDDVMMNLKVMTAMCRKIGAEPVIATSGRDALETVRNGVFDLVLTDLWMPEMDGAELARAIRKHCPELPIVAVTADVESAGNFDMSVFADVITKPVTVDKLLEVIHQVL